LLGDNSPLGKTTCAVLGDNSPRPNFIDAMSAPHSSSEICQTFFENAGTRPVQTQRKDYSFYGKRNIAKFTRSAIWGVQLKSGDN
jgi:hypothetical protein